MPAVSSDWISTTTGGDWSNSLLWSLGTPKFAGDSAFFTVAPGAAYNVTLNELTTVEVMILGVTVGFGSRLTIKGSPAISPTGFCTFVFDSGIVNGTSILAVTGAEGRLVFDNLNGMRVRLEDNLYVHVEATSGVTFETTISGAGRFIKDGGGFLSLENSNTFTGGISLQAGTLFVSSDAALGSGSVTISGDAIFRAGSITINNPINTVQDAVGTAGSALIGASNLSTLELTGTLNHRSQGTITFGASGVMTGTIIANFNTVQDNATNSSYRIGAGTLQFGDAYNAAELFRHPGTGQTSIEAGATLDTRGFATTISNLALNGGTIRSSTGLLGVNVIDVTSGLAAPTGTIIGTANLDYLNYTVNGNLSLAGLTFQSWTISDSIGLYGNETANRIVGTNQMDGIFGNGGDDILIGNGGSDFILGGDGNDSIEVIGSNTGANLQGGSGFDTLRVSNTPIGPLTLAGFSGFEAINLVSAGIEFTSAQFTSLFPATGQISGSGSISINLVAGNTVFAPKLLNVLAGTTIQMNILGTSGTDVIKPHAALTNFIQAGDGSDNIHGGGLADRLFGEGGIDKIAGNGGADELSGGTGADVFKFRSVSDSGIGAANRDRITDYEIGIDKLNFKRIDTNLALAGDQGFNFIGTAAFSGSGAAEIRYAPNTASTFGIIVSADVNGDGIADMSVFLNNPLTSVLTSADFVL